MTNDKAIKLVFKEKILVDLNCMLNDCIAIKDNNQVWDTKDEDNWESFADILTRTIKYIREQTK
jgi:hypothetical protein